MPKKSKKKQKKIKDIDWAADANFDKNRSMVYIEHTTECPIFAVKAEEFAIWLQEEVPDRLIQLVRNNNNKLVARPGAFEINFSQNARTSQHLIWSGLDKGPPRRDKFPPDYYELLPEIVKVLKKFYPDPTLKPQDDMEMDNEGEVY